MKFVAKTMDDRGFTGPDLGKIRKGQTAKLEITYVANAKAIKPGELLLLPPSDWMRYVIALGNKKLDVTPLGISRG